MIKMTDVFLDILLNLILIIYSNIIMGCVCLSNRGRSDSEKQLDELVTSPRPLAFAQELLTDSERRQLLLSVGDLDDDPSSKYFVKRKKSIGYVVHLHDRWFQVTVDYFIQQSEYNDFSGGYRRHYKLLPNSFIECEATQKVLNAFKAEHNIPSGELVLCQVQSSHIGINNSMPDTAYNVHVNPPNVEQQTLAEPLVPSGGSSESLKSDHLAPNGLKPHHKQQYSITGQGIHTDGVDSAALVCLKRENINGAENSIYYDLVGNEDVLSPFVLKEGHILYWRDNKVYHYVNPASLIDKNKNGIRTMILLHHPAIFVITGESNNNNTLGRKVFEREKQLRNQQNQ